MAEAAAAAAAAAAEAAQQAEEAEDDLDWDEVEVVLPAQAAAEQAAAEKVPRRLARHGTRCRTLP